MKHSYGLRQFRKQFPDDTACLDYLFKTRFNSVYACGGYYSKLCNRRQYQCSLCRKQLAPTAGTIFEKTTTPLTLWFHALFVFSHAKSGISAKEMERQLGVTYKTAWRILYLIRSSLSQNYRKLQGEVEMDEAYIGGKGYGGKYNKNLANAMKNKSPVISAIERGGEIRAYVVPDISATTIEEFLRQNVSSFRTHLYTDKSNRYRNVTREYSRFEVNHSAKEFARGKIHVNRVESFWSHVKRSLGGSYKVVSKQHLQGYLDSFVFHYNNRRKTVFPVLLKKILEGNSP